MELDNPTILIVEDNADLADAYQRWLQNTYEVHVVNTSQAARDYVTDADKPVPDIIFLDRGMPDFSGDELLDRLRGDGYEGWVVMVTGKQPTTDVAQLQFDAYVMKPLAEGDLQSVVETIQDRAEYNEKVREYVATKNKMAVLRDSMSADRLGDNAFYAELESYAETLLDEMDATASDLTDLVLTPDQVAE